MVSVPTGGRKKKLKHNIATSEAVVASVIPHPVAISNTTTTYVNAIVVGLTGRIHEYNTVTTATAATDPAMRAIAIRPCMFERPSDYQSLKDFLMFLDIS